MFEYEKEMIREVSEELDIDQERVEYIWKYTLDFLTKKMSDPTAPKILINKFFVFRPVPRLIENRILTLMYKLVHTRHPNVLKKHKTEIINLLETRRRIKKEFK